MKISHISFIMLAVVIFLGFGLEPAHADDANGISIQNILVQPYVIKVGDTFSVTATLVNNSTIPIILDGGTCVPLVKHVPFFTIMLDNHTKIKSKNLTCAGVGLSQILNSSKKITGTSPDSTFFYIATEPGTANVTVTFSYHMTNQTDPTQPNIEQTVSKSFLFTILDNSTGVKSTGNPKITSLIQTPLEQFKSGIAAKDVICRQGLQLIFKFEDSFPACVTKQTAQTLVERGWGMYIPAVTEHDIPILSNSIKVQNTNYTINYNISGSNTLLDAKMDMPSKSLVLSLKTSSNGTLTVSLPRVMIDAKLPNGNDDKLYVLENGQESIFQEINATTIDRTLSIPFTNETHVIEIIGTQMV